MSNQYGKIDISGGKEVIEDVGGTGLSGILIGNESGFTCKVTLTGAGIVRTLYPGTVDFFAIPDGKSWNGNLKIMPIADLSNTADWPGSYVYIDTFGTSERPSGQYPMALPRTGNIGNTVNTSMGGSNTLQNDGNVGTTEFLEATASGSSTSNYSFKTSGDMWIGQYVSSTFKKLWEIVTGSSPVVYLLNRFWAFSGSVLQVADSNGTLANIFGVDGNGFTFLQNHATGKETVIYSSTGSQIVAIDDAGHIVIPNQIGFRAKDVGGTARSILYLDSGNTTQLQSGGGGVDIAASDGSIMIRIDSAGKIGVVAAGDIIDASSTSTYLKSRTGGNVVIQVPSGTTGLRIDGAGKLGVNSAGDLIDASGTDIYIKAPGGGNIIFQSPNGTNVARINGTNGNMVIKGSLTQNGAP